MLWVYKVFYVFCNLWQKVNIVLCVNWLAWQVLFAASTLVERWLWNQLKAFRQSIPDQACPLVLSLFMVIIVNKKHHHHHHHHHCGHDQHGHIRGLAEIGWKYIVTAAWRWSLPLLSHPLVNTEDNFVTCFHTQLEHTEHTEENTVCIGGIFDTRKTQNTNMITLWRCDLFWCILYKPINQYNWGCDQKSETTECH